MAVYTGKVNLINMSNITAAAGVGIQSTRILYATSSSGTVPPDLEGVELKTSEGDILDFASTGSSFHVVDGIMWAQQGENQVALQVSSGIITGFSGWETTVPMVQPGDYLWSKTIYTYTDGKQTITYAVSYQGADGKPGPAGASSAAFKINCDQTEILKFVDSSGDTTINPSILTFSIVKDDPTLLEGKVQIDNLIYSNLSISFYNIDNGQWYKVSDPEVITLDDSHHFNINLERLIQKNYEDDNYPAASTLLSNECILKIEYIYYQTNEKEEQERFNILEFLNVRYGMNKDMAALSVQANGIVASMQDSKMTFDSSGLTIENGAFKIVKTNNEVITPLLYAKDGNLYLRGTLEAASGTFAGELSAATGTFAGELSAATGTFRGELSAASGSFAGDISAASGTIGGFKIENSRLISTNEGAPSIILNGLSGEIEADNIKLGTGAIIKEYIKIGEQVELRAISKSGSEESFIKVENDEGIEILGLKADGTMKIGNGDNIITLSGKDGSITSSSYDTGLGWKISDTHSVFNDVTVKGSIRASVLEYGETQAIGGTLLVRPSTRILNENAQGEETILTLEEVQDFKVGDYCRISLQNESGITSYLYKILSVNTNEKQITVEGRVSGTIGKPIVNLGQAGNNVGISINGSMDDSFASPQAIAVFEFDPQKNKPIERIILGKLPNSQDTYGQAAGTYGLYAENVLLKGSLVTQTKVDNDSAKYSGISTTYGGNSVPKSTILVNHIPNHVPSEILLWAGANGTGAADVENSKFFVDREGNMYAGSGYFNGTIITDATIKASVIETTTLRGYGNEPALRIEDAANGIYFSTKDDLGNVTDVFKVTKDTIIANVPNFVFNSNFTVESNGALIVPTLQVIGIDEGLVASEGKKTNAIILDNKRISYVDISENGQAKEAKGYIDFFDGTIFSPDGVNQVLSLSAQQIEALAPLYISESIKYQEKMEYKPAYDKEDQLIGYDLYIE